MTPTSSDASVGMTVRKDDTSGDFIVTFLALSEIPLEVIRVSETTIAEAPLAAMELFPAAIHLAVGRREETADMLFDTRVAVETGDMLVEITSPPSSEPEVIRVTRDQLAHPPLETRAAHIAARIASEQFRASRA